MAFCNEKPKDIRENYIHLKMYSPLGMKCGSGRPALSLISGERNWIGQPACPPIQVIELIRVLF
jgi:hypothetical protein